MTITRTINGVEHAIELTEKELTAAYYERQAVFDREDVKHIIDEDKEEFTELFGVSESELYAMIGDIAQHYRKDLDNEDSWYETLDFCVRDFLEQYARFEKED